jgi:hypothetical protein
MVPNHLKALPAAQSCWIVPPVSFSRELRMKTNQKPNTVRVLRIDSRLVLGANCHFANCQLLSLSVDRSLLVASQKPKKERQVFLSFVSSPGSRLERRPGHKSSF